MAVFTFSKRGDQGNTSLLTGEIVSKSNLRPETYGTLDEASSALGLSKSLTGNEQIRGMIQKVQEDLLSLGAELSSEGGGNERHRIGPGQITRLEHWIEELQGEVELPRHFIFPGANAVSAALDLARTIIRRAERRAVAMKESGLLHHDEVHAYLNRLSDYLFVLARYAEKRG